MKEKSLFLAEKIRVRIDVTVRRLTLKSDLFL